MIAEHELRDALEHRHLDGLALAGAFAMEERGGDRIDHVQTGDAVGEVRRARTAGVAVPLREASQGRPVAPWMRSS